MKLPAVKVPQVTKLVSAFPASKASVLINAYHSEFARKLLVLVSQLGVILVDADISHSSLATEKLFQVLIDEQLPVTASHHWSRNCVFSETDAPHVFASVIRILFV